MPWTYQSSKDGFTVADIPDNVEIGSPEFVQLVTTMRGKSDSIGNTPPSPDPVPPVEPEGPGFLDRMVATAKDMAPGIVRGAAPIATGAVMGAAMGAPFAGVGAAPGAVLGAGGATGLTLIGDPAAALINSIAGEQVVRGPTEVINDVLDGMGLPRPETPQGRIAQAASQAVSSAGGMIGAGKMLAGSSSPLIAQIGADLSANIPAQVSGAIGSGVASQGAAELGGGPFAQIAAGLVGGMGSSMIGGKSFAQPHAIDPATGLRMAPETARNVVAMRNAEALGIPVRTTDVFPPQSWPAKWAKSLIDKMPFATSGMNSAQAEARQSAVNRFIADIGATGKIERSVGAATENLLKNRQAELAKNIANKADVIARANGAGPVNVAATNAEIDRQIANLRAMRNAEVEPAIAQLENARNSLQNQPLAYIEENRKILGDKLKDLQLGAVTKTKLQAAASAIYKTLNQDMKAHIEGALGTPDANRWAVANKRLAGMMDEVNAARSRDILAVVRNGEANPAKLQKVILNGTESDVRTAYKYMDAKGRDAVRQSYVDKAIDVATGGRGLDGAAPVSVDQFKNALQTAVKRGGPFMEGPGGDQIRGLIRALDLTVEGARSNQLAQTGAMNAPLLVGGAVLGGDMLGTTKALAAIGGASILARAYQSPATRNALIRLAKTKRGTEDEYSAINRLMIQTAVFANDEDRKKGAKK